ncbi:MAG: tRNA pseudouridine(13) synthase TruD [Patescibacteria group bacterium]
MLTPEERERERLLFESERARAPHLFQRPPMIDHEPFLKWIGIEGLPPNRPIGYLRLLPQDFIVEEIDPTGTLHTVDLGPLVTDLSADGTTYYADLVKIGVSTLDAKDHLATLLGIDGKQIGFAGIKDRLALTAQRLSIRGVSDVEQFNRINEENFFLKHLCRGKGAVANGDLTGNRFIIILRTTESFSKEAIAAVKEKLEDIKRDGFWNFFYFQRFGTPRLISHWLGLLLIKGQYQEVIKTFLTYAALRELPYFKNIREKINENWGNWAAIKEEIEKFPYHFHLELQLINHLLTHPDDFLGALHTIPDQIRLWMYAYDCFLFNRKLSELIRIGEVPTLLPLITSFNPRDWEPYREFLEGDEVKLPSRSYRDFPFVRVESRTWSTLQKIEIHGIELKSSLAVFAFSLPKGSYATTFLMNFFTLASGLPIVPGITAEKIDAKVLLGLGTLATTLERFKTVLEKREEDLSAGME